MRIDIEKIKQLHKELRDFNKLSIYDIEFYENGEKIEISKLILDEWEFIGLNNANFIDTEFWKAHREEIRRQDDKETPNIKQG